VKCKDTCILFVGVLLEWLEFILYILLQYISEGNIALFYIALYLVIGFPIVIYTWQSWSVDEIELIITQLNYPTL